MLHELLQKFDHVVLLIHDLKSDGKLEPVLILIRVIKLVYFVFSENILR